MKNLSIIDFRRERIERLRDIYNQGIDRTEVDSQITAITQAREGLMKEFNIIIYDDKIRYVTKQLSKLRKRKGEYVIIFLTFAKCFDFILSYDDTDELRESFIQYCNILYSFFEEKNDTKNLVPQIKMKTFELQSKLIEIHIRQKKKARKWNKKQNLVAVVLGNYYFLL